MKLYEVSMDNEEGIEVNIPRVELSIKNVLRLAVTLKSDSEFFINTLTDLGESKEYINRIIAEIEKERKENVKYDRLLVKKLEPKDFTIQELEDKLIRLGYTKEKLESLFNEFKKIQKSKEWGM